MISYTYVYMTNAVDETSLSEPRRKCRRLSVRRAVSTSEAELLSNLLRAIRRHRPVVSVRGDGRTKSQTSTDNLERNLFNKSPVCSTVRVGSMTICMIWLWSLFSVRTSCSMICHSFVQCLRTSGSPFIWVQIVTRLNSGLHIPSIFNKKPDKSLTWSNEAIAFKIWIFSVVLGCEPYCRTVVAEERWPVVGSCGEFFDQLSDC
jgi:hypothetical protein